MKNDRHSKIFQFKQIVKKKLAMVSEKMCINLRRLWK